MKADDPKEHASFWDNDPTDGRDDWNWKSEYPVNIRIVIWCEAAYLSFWFLLSWGLLFLVWTNYFECTLVEKVGASAYGAFKQVSYFSLGGILGGLVFGFKYMFHVVAKGRWHLDRQLWRFLSPFMSLTVAVMIASLFGIGGELGDTQSPIESTLVGSIPVSEISSLLGLGFVTGYFSDKAIAKMQEIASVMFGTADRPGKHS